MLFPNVFLPLHIFEPRYREMVADALDGDRIIGMALLRPGWEGNYEGRPPIYPVGCAGLITHAERLPDGRYNIVAARAGEVQDRARRRAARLPHRAKSMPIMEAARRATTATSSAPSGGAWRRCSCRSRQDAASTRRCRRRWATRISSTRSRSISSSRPVEKQALLERDGLLARCRSLIELLEMKVIVSRHKWGLGGN